MEQSGTIDVYFSDTTIFPYMNAEDLNRNSSTFYDASSLNETSGPTSGGGYSYIESTVIAVVAGILSLLTIFGNVLVMVSFKLDKQLQTISNYFLLSLAGKSLRVSLSQFFHLML
jgi:hypothetical protein